MNYIQFSNSLIPLLHVCKLHCIPSEISFIIYNYLINNSAQIIINSWYDYVIIHVINPCDIISRLHLCVDYDNMGIPFYYFDLYDKKVGITFNICSKFIDLRICDVGWWIKRLNYVYNGFIHYDNDNENFIYNCDAIATLYNKLFT